jgi:hypothetical protein
MTLSKTIFHLFFILIFFVSACSKGENNSETVELEEIIPQSEREYDYTVEEDSIVPQKPIHPAVIKLVEMLQSKSVDKENGNHFPNRFSFESHEDYIIVKNMDTIHYSHWYYEDSLRTTSALFNWMDCFGTDCQSLRFSEELTLQSPRNFSLWATDTALIFIQADERFSIQEWSNAIEQVYFPGKEPNYHFFQQGRKINWWKKEVIDRENE